MPTLASKLNPRSEDFKANAAAMRALVDDLSIERFAVVGHGYEVKADGFGYRGVRLVPKPGETITVAVERTNIHISSSVDLML